MIDWTKTEPRMREAFFAYKKHCKETGKTAPSASAFAAGFNAAKWCKV